MKLFCPLPRRFAVIQMDPVGMVKHYNDPIALAAAQALRPQKYLVYLNSPRDLPTPQKPWFRYDMMPIASTLRAEDPEQGITADMVIPIFPNTSHPAGRTPIVLETPFPFPNCYFWISSNLTVRLRRKAIRYDDACAPILSIRESQKISELFMDDYLRLRTFRYGQLDETEELESMTDHLGHSVPGFQPGPSSDPGSSLRDGGVRDGSHSGYATTSSASTGYAHSVNDSIAFLQQLDIFGLNIDHTIEFVPLVDLWFEVTEHLTADTIPSPVDLYREHETIMQIIHDARERATSIRSVYIGSVISIDYDAISNLHVEHSETIMPSRFSSATPAPAPNPVKPTDLAPPRRANAWAMWRKVRGAAKRMLTMPLPRRWRVHPPYMPYWP